MCDTGAKG